MQTVTIDGVTMAMPTREDIESLSVGDIAPHSLGEGPIVEVFAIGNDSCGRAYVCYYAQWGHAGSTISHSLTEGLIDWPVNDGHTYPERCQIRAAHEPGILRDHYGYPIDSNGRRISTKK